MGWGQEMPDGKGSGWAGCIGQPTRTQTPMPLPYNQVSLADALRIFDKHDVRLSDRNIKLPILTRTGKVCGEIHLGLIKGKWSVRGIFLQGNDAKFMVSLKNSLKEMGFVVHQR